MAEISALIEGGKATAGAPLGPALGPLGVNIGEIVAKINEKTKDYAGMKVPVTLEIHKDKSYEITVGSPPTSAIILKELNIKKGGANQKTDVVGNLSMEQVKKLAEMKIGALTSTKVIAAAREIIGTCNSMSVTVEGKRAGEMQKEFTEGKWDSFFSGGAKPKVDVNEIADDVKENLQEAGKDIVEESKEIIEKVEKKAEEIIEKVEEKIEEVIHPEKKEAHVTEAPKESKDETIVEKVEGAVSEVKEELKEEIKEELKSDVKEDVEEIKEEIKEEAIEKVKEEVKEEIKEELKEEVKEELKADVKEEVIEEIKEEVKEEIKEEIKEEVKAEVKEEPPSKGISYSQHMKQMEQEAGVSKEDAPKKVIEVEKTETDSTEITRPKKKK